MNQQKPESKNAIGWTRVQGRRGFTWNPVVGCQHKCQWKMGDKMIDCYAQDTVQGRWLQDIYPEGFEHHYWMPERLDEPRHMRNPAGIFVCSIADLMGRWVPSEQIEQVIQVMRDCPQHIFMILTKNAPRLLKFQWPVNAWIGVSAPPTAMYGTVLDDRQRHVWYDHALGVLEKVDVPVRWTSIEPLSWDVSLILRKHCRVVQWAVIGAASDGAQKFQPDPAIFRNVVVALNDMDTPIYLKENVTPIMADLVCGSFRQEWPQLEGQNAADI